MLSAIIFVKVSAVCAGTWFRRTITRTDNLARAYAATRVHCRRLLRFWNQVFAQTADFIFDEVFEMKIKNFTLNSIDQVIVKIVGEVLRAFHIEIASATETADFDKFEIENAVKDEKVTTRLTVEKDGAKKIFKISGNLRPEEKRRAEIHRLVKKNLYEILTEDLNFAPVPYGIMHGVRPTKIIHRWISQGYGVTSHGIFDRDKISRRLRKDYLTSYEKSQLLTEVAIRQIPILNSADEKSIGVYIGIPFCVTRCLYCSFPANVLPSEEKISEFMEVLTKDINAAANEIKKYGFKVQSIYIGGGTPTALPEKFFAEMLEKVFKNFYSETVEEFTVECGRPDTINAEKISAMKNFQVTRVCVNPQTMQQKTLDRIGRQHTTEQVITAFNGLRTAGDWKINMDLILGLPGENLNDVKDSLEKILELNPDDVTLHALALKRGSQLQTQLADEINTLEDFDLPSDEEVRKMSDAAEKILRTKNYLPYYLYRQGYISGQIENIAYCKRGAEGIYNIQIMGERQIILGIGVAASTKVPDAKNLCLQSSFNAKDLTTYLRDIDIYIANREKILAEVFEVESLKGEKVESFSEPVKVHEAEENISEPVEVHEVDEKISEPAEIHEVEESISAPVEVHEVEENIPEPVEKISKRKKKKKSKKKKVLTDEN